MSNSRRITKLIPNGTYTSDDRGYETENKSRVAFYFCEFTDTWHFVIKAGNHKGDYLIKFAYEYLPYSFAEEIHRAFYKLQK